MFHRNILMVSQYQVVAAILADFRTPVSQQVLRSRQPRDTRKDTGGQPRDAKEDAGGQVRRWSSPDTAVVEWKDVELEKSLNLIGPFHFQIVLRHALAHV